ncbi:MAG: hypothetical protein Q9M35_05050 [Rhodothermus sp.]|nr:hypothetical protein [Rhodothermus sp.]
MSNRIRHWLTHGLLRLLRPREQAVLQQVNLARRALGRAPLQQLPTGRPRHARQCPLAQTLGGLVGPCGIAYTSRKQAQRVARAWGTRWEQRIRRYLVYFPPELSRFVQDYDLHAFPHLEIRSTFPLTTA